MQPAAGVLRMVFDRRHIKVAGFIAHNDFLLKGHLPAFRVPVSRGQQAVAAGVFGGIAVQLAFVMPQGHHAVADILLCAAVQLFAHSQECRGGTAVQPAGNIVPPAVVRDIGRTSGVAVIAVKHRLFVPEPRLLDQQQLFPLLRTGQKFFRGNDLPAGQVGVEKEEIIQLFQRLFLG